MHQSITLLALLSGFVGALPQLELPNRLHLQFPEIDGTPLTAEQCDYDTPAVWSDGWQDLTLVQSNLTDSYLDSSPTGGIPSDCATSPGTATSKHRRTTEEITHAKEKRAEIERCETRAQLKFSNLPNSGPWRTPEPEWFGANSKNIYISWSPGAVVTSVIVYKVGSVVDENYGVPVYMGQACNPQRFWSIPPSPDLRGWLTFELRFDPTIPLNLSDDKKLELAVFDVWLKE
ncbi:MAG: hypothetical protein Q9226_003540 [Calogaya cf. arnoldii]